MFTEFINNLANLETYVVAENFAKVSTGERLLFGSFMLVIGISTTFIALLVIQMTINVQAYLISGERKEPTKKNKKIKPMQASNHLADIHSGKEKSNSSGSISPKNTNNDYDEEIVAAITAAIYSMFGKGIVVKNIIRGRKANVNFPERY